MIYRHASGVHIPQAFTHADTHTYTYANPYIHLCVHIHVARFFLLFLFLVEPYLWTNMACWLISSPQCYTIVMRQYQNLVVALGVTWGRINNKCPALDFKAERGGSDTHDWALSPSHLRALPVSCSGWSPVSPRIPGGLVIGDNTRQSRWAGAWGSISPQPVWDTGSSLPQPTQGYHLINPITKSHVIARPSFPQAWLGHSDALQK